MSTLRIFVIRPSSSLLFATTEISTFQPHSYVEFEGLMVDTDCQSNIFDGQTKGIHKDNIVGMVSSNPAPPHYFSELRIDTSSLLSVPDDVDGLVRCNYLPCPVHPSKQAPRIVSDQIPVINDDFICSKNNLG